MSNHTRKRTPPGTALWAVLVVLAAAGGTVVGFDRHDVTAFGPEGAQHVLASR